jgi:hypothetical protein
MTTERPTDYQLGIDTEHENYCDTIDALESKIKLSSFYQALAAWAFVQEEHERASFGLSTELPTDISAKHVEIFRLHFRLKALYEWQAIAIWRLEHFGEYEDEMDAEHIQDRQENWK